MKGVHSHSLSRGCGLKCQKGAEDQLQALSPDILRVDCTHVQGIRAAVVAVFLKLLIMQKIIMLGPHGG